MTMSCFFPLGESKLETNELVLECDYVEPSMLRFVGNSTGFFFVVSPCYVLTLTVQDTQTMHLKLGLFLRFLASTK